MSVHYFEGVGRRKEAVARAAEAWDRLRAEQAQVAQLRKKELDRIFPEEG